MAHLYKSRLQNYAQKKNIAFPMYACEMQGPPHSRLFKARVTIDGVMYEGPEFCTTLKDAEHAAAKVAFTSLSPDGAKEDDCLYKSLLQELAQKKGLVLPVYATNRAGPPHMPSFASTVQIAGKCFVGQEARTKKQAEMNAAKVAYTDLTEGGPRVNNAAVFSDIQMVGTSSFGSSSAQMVVADKKEPTLISSTSKMGTTINDQASCSIAKEAEKAKGLYWMTTIPNEDTEKQRVTLPPVVIHQPQSKTTPNVVDSVKLNVGRENLVSQAHEGSGLNGKRSQQNQSSVTDLGAAKPVSTKIVIRPHVHGMTYEGPIEVADDEWVAMKVNVDDEA
ncbi:double-stranded RNA-binding protein 4 [Cynara cardunculus var. scolymus]|uniref:double-stranded RNA-binding protein 4 n=1 Tax=Cynara cardunculus var. scolymus TaxID=59895 RepID=UPI000D62A64D|nr:double-stranded RNA-binding protein 4 [Cynara cardunculus var. scolymus]